jgi:hypothetical protein
MRSRSRSTCWRAWARACERLIQRVYGKPSCREIGAAPVKLRIQGNLLRLRLTQKEVAQLRDRGCVESAIELAPGRALTYLLEGSFRADSVTADFDGKAIRVTVPARVITEWAESDRVGIEAPSESGAQLLIEKDFQCLHNERSEDPDAYPNPRVV